MKVFAVVPAVSLLLAAATSFAQTPAAPPRTTAPAGQSSPAPRPPARQPDPPPAAAALPAPPPPPVVAFRDGARIGFINVQAIASQSADGRAAGVKIKQFQDTRARDLDSKQKALEQKRQRLESGGAVLNDSTRSQLTSEIERDQRELSRLAEDADQDLERMTQQLQQEFMVKLGPIIKKVAQDKKIDFIFTDQSGIVFAADDLNLTADVITALDGAAPAAAPAAAKPPAATPPAAAKPPAATPPATTPR
jgi:Skp family chaperone for outer membrane proteins